MRSPTGRRHEGARPHEPGAGIPMAGRSRIGDRRPERRCTDSRPGGRCVMETKAFGAKRSMVGVTLILTAAAVAFLAIGCGEQKSKTTIQRAEANGVASGVVAAAEERAPAIAASAEGTTTEGGTTGAETTATPSA